MCQRSQTAVSPPLPFLSGNIGYIHCKEQWFLVSFILSVICEGCSASYTTLPLLG